MQVRLFGELEAVAEGVPVPVRGAKQRALLALLALQRGQPVSADRLIDVLWGDGQAAHPANALQAQIGQLRRTFGAAAILTSEAGYALAVGPDDVDIVRFGRLVAEGRRLAVDGEAALASAVLGEALGLRRGEPLAEFADAGFASAERAQLEELTLLAVEARAGADLMLGRHGELAAELEALRQQHPLRERLWELHILALYRAGRQAEALRAYTEVRDRLVDELGIDPGPALRELQARILAQDPSLAPASAAPASAQASPAPVPAAAPLASAGNLRARLSRFVGRDAELGQLNEAVRSSRLVTLTGPGGAGKTRLAVETAAALRPEHRDGAWLVELASVVEPDGVAPAAAAALGAGAAALPGVQPAGSATDLIVRYLAGRSLVVVLDNCEHVIGEAAALADTLAGAVPGLRLIATSREPLGVPGEVLVPVGGLAPLAAAELFVDRARAVRPGLHRRPAQAADVIEDICRRLDGLPLAVELAAARLRALPLATLAERLDDRFQLLSRGARTALPRQQTLRAVVDWSYDLLFSDERRLFARLAAFTGGCGLPAAEAVCADDQVPAARSSMCSAGWSTSPSSQPPATGPRPGSASSRPCGSTAGNGSANPAKPTPSGPATGRITGSWPPKPTRACAVPPGPGTGTVSSRSQATCGPRSTGTSPRAMPTRRYRWPREWPGCGSSPATSSKEPAGSVTRSAPKGRAASKRNRPPASGTATAWACRLTRRRASSNARRPWPSSPATTGFAWPRRW